MAGRIVPMLAYADAAAAIDWLCAAFGATEDASSRITDGHGTIGHAELDFDGAKVFLATPSPHYEGPRTHRGHCEAAARWQENDWVVDGLFVEVGDVDAHAARARGHGATILRGPEEPGIGYRIYTAEDPEGHRWMFGQRL